MAETLEQIIDEIADNLGIYGAHGEEHPDGQCECRVCFAMQMSTRIREALENEEAARRAHLLRGVSKEQWAEIEASL